MTKKKETTERPRAALITNHGYPAPKLPIGGAPDTGGQNVYVHNLALALEEIGYDVTIFARGGFPHFGVKKLRKGKEKFSEHVFYQYVPGGGNEFIPKENISVALDEELDWLEHHIDEEASKRGIQPWELFEFINTHYWDAAVLGMGLVTRWQDRIAAKAIVDLVAGLVPQERLDAFLAEARWTSPASAVAYHLGNLILEPQRSMGPFLKNAIKEAARSWARKHRKNAGQLISATERALSSTRRTLAQSLRPLVAAEALGQAILQAKPKTTAKLRVRLGLADRHVWTPHSLGILKQERYASRPAEAQRSLRFCERRAHEQAVCHATRTFAATSQEIAERLVTNLGVGADRLFFYPPCIDHSVFRSYEPTETTKTYKYLAKKSGVAIDTLRKAHIVFETSRMDTSKRKDVLLRAFAKVAPKIQDSYLFIGGGPENDVFESLRHIVEETPSLDGRAFLLGYVPDEHMGPLFSLADLYVSPSEMEGFGMSVAQAAASATAVVCTETIPFVEQYGADDVVTLPPGDIKGFADAIQAFLKDDKKRSEKGYRLADRTKALSWRHQTELFLKHLRRHAFPITLP